VRSVGLFQQQGELYADVLRTDPADTSRAFYNQLTARIPNYTDPAAGTFAEIAQTVQASGAGAAKYAAWESWATALAADLYSGTPPQGGSTDARTGSGQIHCQVGGGSGPIHVTVRGLTIVAPPESGVTGSWIFPSEKAATAAAAALSYLGTPYSWGGGSATGPSAGSDGTVGFDCSGLTRYAWAQAGITLPRVARDQQKMPNQQPFSAVEPGDLLFWGSPAHHVTIYLGRLGGADLMVEAPTTGDVVEVSPVRPAGLQNTVVRPA
jgi:cell wall-associated NlpC family hydrolase